MRTASYAIAFSTILMIFGCSTTSKINKGKIVPPQFKETLSFQTAKGIILIPCQYKGQIKNYYFDTGAQLSNIQRAQLKGKRISVRGASNRIIESGTEVLKSFKIGEVEFKNTFATNSDAKGLKEQIPNFGGIIGRTIIDKANWLIDLPNKTLTISDEELSDALFTDIPIEKNSIGAAYTMIRVNGNSYKAIIDLGSTAMVNVPKRSPLAKLLVEEYSFEDQKRVRYTAGGNLSIVQQVCTIPSIQMGELTFHNVEVTINESSQVRVGINLFKNNIVYIDNINSRYRVNTNVY